jgi:hypothetical protein
MCMLVCVRERKYLPFSSDIIHLWASTYFCLFDKKERKKDVICTSTTQFSYMFHTYIIWFDIGVVMFSIAQFGRRTPTHETQRAIIG